MRRFEAAWLYDGNFTDVTDSLGNGSAAVTVAAGEKLYLASRELLSGAFFRVSTAPTSPDLVPEMYDGRTDAWVRLPIQEAYDQLETGHGLDTSAYSFERDGVLYWGRAQYLWVARQATTNSFPEPAGAVPNNQTLYWVRLRNAGANSVTLDRALPVLYNTYITSEQVAGFMEARLFDEATQPRLTEVRDAIARAEDHVDRYTRQTWRLRQVRNEHQKFNPYGFTPAQRPVVTVTRLHLWNGSSFQELTEGRGEQWFFDPRAQMVYFTLPSYMLRNYSWLLGRHIRQPGSVQLDYVAGADYDMAPQRGVVERAMLRLVAGEIVASHDYSALLTSNDNAVSKTDKARRWQEEAEAALNLLRAPKVA